MIRGIILEGISCSGKTSLLNSLKRIHAENPENERSVIILGEHYSQVLQSVHGEASKYSNREHIEILNGRVEMLESLSNHSESLGPHSRRARGVFFIYERFHLNHRQAFPDNEQNNIENIEARLCNLNAVCYLLSISNSKVGERLIARDNHMSTLADSDMQLKVNEYTHRRDELDIIASSSLLEYKTLNTDSLNWDMYANNIIAEIGGQS